MAQIPQSAQSYHPFHSQRDPTATNLQSSQQLLESQALMRHYHIRYPIQHLLQHFKHIFNNKGYKSTQVFPGRVLLVRLGVRDRIRYIFTGRYTVVYCRQPRKYMLSVETQQYRSTRRLSIKMLRGQNEGQSEAQEIREMLQWIDMHPVPEFKNESSGKVEAEVGQSEQDMHSLSTTATYMFHKILADNKYSLGQKISKLVAQTSRDEDKHTEKSARTAIGGVKEVADDLLKSFNCTRKQMLLILCHCRRAVEDYYHHRKFRLKAKETIDLHRGEVETEVAEKVPQTVKAFYRLAEEPNSQRIIFDIFVIRYVFQLECEIRQFSKNEVKALTQKLYNNFGKKILAKTKVLDLWGYHPRVYCEFLNDFVVPV